MFNSDPMRHEQEWAQGIGQDAALMKFAGCSDAAIAAYVDQKWPADQLSQAAYLRIARAAYRSMLNRIEAGKPAGDWFARLTYSGELVYCRRSSFARLCMVDAGARGFARLIGFRWEPAAQAA